MKYFRFYCGLNPEFPHDLRSDYNETMREADSFCGYLARMYEFYFPATKTDKVSAFDVYLVDKLPEDIQFPQGQFSSTYNVINWTAFKRLSLREKPLYIIELCQQSMIDFARKENWNLTAFETAFEKINANNGLFREHWKKPVFSPNKQIKAQTYFEDDYEKKGTYIDFTNKEGNLIKRVQFTPSGYSVYCRDIGAIKWEDNFSVKIYYLQTPRAGADYEGNTRDYWIVRTDGTVEFHYPRVEGVEPNPHGLFNLGILYWNGTTIMQDKEKGIELIRQSAELKYKHAEKWLKRNK